MKKLIVTLTVMSAAIIAARADEGMWMVNAISKALVQKMEARGLKLEAGEIYDADKVTVKDAIVSLDFGCTGSMISPRGLLITNHHCAYADVHALSTKEHNYLENGFSARSEAEEIYIPGKSAYFLQKVLDVTDEVNALIETEKSKGKGTGMRRLSYLMEKKYNGQTGLEASLSSMWSGSRYYLALYKVYTDIRLVAAPPVSIAAFGGDIDNWEWPQHKCDFAIYRIYTAPDGSPAPHSDANVPMHPARHLKISTAGYRPGDFTMVLGYPGRTDRYSSSAKVAFKQNLNLPISSEARGKQMEIINRWMNADPEIRLKYADKYFSLSNVQELYDGEVQCYRRFKVVDGKEKMEKGSRDGELLNLVSELQSKYASAEAAQRDITWYRESLVRCTPMSRIATKLKNAKKTGFNYEKEYEGLDMRVEKDLFRLALELYYGHVSASMWGPYQKELYEKYGTADAVAEFLWVDRYMTVDDPIFTFMNDVQIVKFNKLVSRLEGEPNIAELGRRYTRRLYSWREEKGILQYPDANSTMRLTYGTVGTFRRDGKKMPWQTLSGEILAKENDTYEFSLKPEWRAQLQGSRIPVDFITDNDITGGNSGSPVLNARGELIGLAFDGNKESLAGDSSWTKGYNKCVCTDIRFVLWTLEKYMKPDYIIKEIND